MYTSAHCQKSALLVILFTGRDSSDEEYEHMLGAWSQLYREAQGRPTIGVVVIEPGHAAPNAGWRRRIAAVHRAQKAPRRIALVTDNPLIRAVITAVDWMTPPGPHQHTSAFGTFDDAVRTLEAQEGRPLDRLRALYQEAREAARGVA
jgi:hypothetical protein